MGYHVRFTPSAADDLQRLFDFLAEIDLAAAERARDVIAKALGFLQMFPFSCRKASSGNAFLRELVISFGEYGYVALFEIGDTDTVTMLAVRHQREDDYY